MVQNDNTRGARGLCLEVHDLLVSKAIAGREKDVTFIGHAAAHGLADGTIALARLETVEIQPARRERAQAVIRRAFHVPVAPAR